MGLVRTAVDKSTLMKQSKIKHYQDNLLYLLKQTLPNQLLACPHFSSEDAGLSSSIVRYVDATLRDIVKANYKIQYVDCTEECTGRDVFIV